MQSREHKDDDGGGARLPSVTLTASTSGSSSPRFFPGSRVVGLVRSRYLRAPRELAEEGGKEEDDEEGEATDAFEEIPEEMEDEAETVRGSHSRS